MTKGRPDTDDGYTRIAHELLEAFARTRISGEARQVLDVICRQTYGYGEKLDAISLRQFMEKTGLKKPAVCRAINKLIDMNIIIKKDNGSIVNYGVQKYYKKWQPLSKKITLAKKIISVDKKDNPPLAKKSTTIDSIKDNIKYIYASVLYRDYFKKKITQSEQDIIAELFSDIPDKIVKAVFTEFWESFEKQNPKTGKYNAAPKPKFLLSLCKKAMKPKTEIYYVCSNCKNEVSGQYGSCQKCNLNKEPIKKEREKA